jgi:predicted SnoaL-like aldol condensation-catalyzing enzyme
MCEEYTFIDAEGNVHDNRDWVVTSWIDLFKVVPDYRLAIDDIFANGEVVAVFGSRGGTYMGKRGAVSEPAKSSPAAWRVVVENGKVRQWQVYTDYTYGWLVMNIKTVKSHEKFII